MPARPSPLIGDEDSESRSYHKDSYMANRRGDSLGQEGRYRRTASPQTAKKSATLLSQMAELSRQQVNMQQLAQPPMPMDGDAAARDLVTEHNLSVGATAWENRNRTISGGSTTVIFTSDALKRIRREERRKTPPEIAPKPPRNHPLLLHQFSRSTAVLSRSSTEADEYAASSSSAVPARPHQAFYTSPLHAAKSTPSLVDSAGSPEGSLKNNSKWMNSVDSLDTVSSAASSSAGPGPNKQHGEEANNVTSEFGNPEDRPDIDANFPGLNYTGNDEPETEPELPKVVGEDTTALNVPKRSTSMNSGCTTASSSTSSHHHAHSHSDSGLSSLSHGCGRTSTMSPVSTLSTVSSVSSSSTGGGGQQRQGGSGPSAGSSRASLRSASIVSSVSPPESLKEEEDDDVKDDAGGICPPLGDTSNIVENVNPVAAATEESFERGSNDSGTGTLKKGVTLAMGSSAMAAMRAKEHKLPEELDCERLSREVFLADAGGDLKLQSLFVPSPQQKTLADYIEGILVIDVDASNSRRRSRTAAAAVAVNGGNNNGNLSPNLLRRKIEELKDSGESNNTAAMRIHPGSSSPNGVGVAINGSDVANVAVATNGGTNGSDCNGSTRTAAMVVAETAVELTAEAQLYRMKEELLTRIAHKLNVLRAEQLSLKEEVEANEELGAGVRDVVHRTAKPNECVKFNLHVAEIDKITSLLLGLSARLARTENDIQGLPPETTTAEKKILESKRSKLASQLDEAKSLKESIDRRSAAVSGFLHSYLGGEEFADYEHFVKMKAKLIMDGREVADKIVLGEEQLRALRESMRMTTEVVTKT